MASCVTFLYKLLTDLATKLEFTCRRAAVLSGKEKVDGGGGAAGKGTALQRGGQAVDEAWSGVRWSC